MRVIAMVCFVAGCGGWSQRDTVLELTSAGFNATDGLESRDIVGRCLESNPVVGRCGDVVPLGVYVPMTLVLHAAISAALPAGPMRTAWQLASTGLEFAIVTNNMSLGYMPWGADMSASQHH